MNHLDKNFLIRQFAAQLDQMEKRNLVPLFFVVGKVVGDEGNEDLKLAASPIILYPKMPPIEPDTVKHICFLIGNSDFKQAVFETVILKNFEPKDN